MKTFIKFACVVAVASIAATQARAQTLASDNFSYPDGDLVTVSSGAWSTFSGANPLNVLSGQASLTAGAGSWQDDQLGLSGGAHSSDVIYYGFDANILSWPTGAGAYFALFKDTSTANFFARTFVTNAGPGEVRFGVANQSATTATAVFWGSTVATGTWHRIIVRLDQTGVDAVSTMWIDSSLETDPSISAFDATTVTNLPVIAFALRQSNAQQGTSLVDNLIVATDFATVVPEPSTMVLVGAGLVGLLAMRRRRA